MLPETIMLVNADGSTRETTRDAFSAILNSKLRNVVTSEGSVIAKVVSSNEWTDDNGEERIILGFNAIASDQVATIKEHLANGEFSDALNVSLTSNLRPNASFIPAKGESVKLSIGMVKNRVEEDVLRVTGVSPLPKAATKSFTLDDLLTGNSTPPVSTEPEITKESINSMDANQIASLAAANGVDLSGFTNSQGKVAQAKLAGARAHLIAELV